MVHIKLSLQDLIQLKSFTGVALHKINLDLRRVRRNKTLIQERYNKTPKQIIIDNGTTSPDEDIEDLKIARQEARLIDSKLSKMIKDTE